VREIRDRLAELDAAPVALVAALVAAVALVAAFLVGWATAGTREHLNVAVTEAAPAAPPPLVLLGRAAPLPEAPPKRSRSGRITGAPPFPASPSASVPKLISGTG
jgi:hypothetical protein